MKKGGRGKGERDVTYDELGPSWYVLIMEEGSQGQKRRLPSTFNKKRSASTQQAQGSKFHDNPNEHQADFSGMHSYNQG